MRRPDRPLRVLIVDDDPDDHVLTEDYLQEATRAKFVVDHARSAEEALEKMVAGAYDVCLLDYALGATDGVQVFRQARENGFDSPTILLSGHDSEDVADQVLQAGLADYVEKRTIAGSSLERAILYALERDASRREIVALNRSLEERVRERTHELESFCYSVSHDLRAPLRSINATSAILREDFGELLPKEAVGELDRQREASARLGQLIDDLLQFVRLGQTQEERLAFDMTALAKAVAAELRIEIEVQEGMHAVGDPTLVRLLVMNLFDNAAKFCGDHSPCVTMGSRDGAFFGEERGLGFDPRYTGKLFEPFQRLHRDSDVPGTGIGLANVKRIVDRHRGRVWAEGRPNDGATFWFTLGEPSAA